MITADIPLGIFSSRRTPEDSTSSISRTAQDQQAGATTAGVLPRLPLEESYWGEDSSLGLVTIQTYSCVITSSCRRNPSAGLPSSSGTCNKSRTLEFPVPAALRSNRKTWDDSSAAAGVPASPALVIRRQQLRFVFRRSTTLVVRLRHPLFVPDTCDSSSDLPALVIRPQHLPFVFRPPSTYDLS